MRHIFFSLLFTFFFTILVSPISALAAKTIHVLASTFPIYQITRNVTLGVDGVELDLMIPAGLGCPHDYALTPQDMHKLAKADLLVINGLGMEEFLGAPLKKANAGLQIIDSSTGITPLPMREVEHDEVHDAHEVHHEEEHHHNGSPNPHLFASPAMAALIAENIAQDLAIKYPEKAEQIRTNGAAYSKKMRSLAHKMKQTGSTLRNNRIVTQHGVFDYLARDMGLEVVAVVQAHAGQNPSASEMLSIVSIIKSSKAGAIFTEPQYPEAIGRTLARETGIKSARLDPAATGPELAPIDYYQQIMQGNLKTLVDTLGSR